MADSAVSKQPAGRQFMRWLLEERIEEVQGPEAREEKCSMRGGRSSA